ncbi:Sec-independent protein translocase protein TatB [Chitiniphilus shinanonensis]|uniref:Sec-independent protein translocase protein TatB n=1 Tax=Chitiniphilus shinanonensis TaxID=553088 RepID=A0ABQ6BQU2_9NEIS|nr:Sec-independent protein translocase protein TatB [Chitiniphilus shinanonensis]GLS04191.1 Sec-independent protein translocase protein TatB [Chitiniphilus shinanonensis]
MFDVGFGELIVIGAVGLVVLGPERLPKVARTLGALLGRAQRFAASVKADLDRELGQTELARIEAELREEGDALRQTIHQPLADARDEVTGLNRELAALEQAPPSPAPAVAVPSTGIGEVSPPAPTALPAVAQPAADPVLPPERDERQLDLFADPAPPRGPERDRR